MEIKAHIRYARMSPKKIRLVTNLITGMPVDQAIAQLSVLTKAARRPVEKLLLSAVANAEHNFGLERSNLKVRAMTADLAGMLKRFTPKAHGRATVIRKRLSHVDLILAEIVPTTPKKRSQPKAHVGTTTQQPHDHPETTVTSPKNETIPAGHETEAGHEIVDPRMEGKHRHGQHTDQRSSKAGGGIRRKFFNRKSG